MKCSAASQKDSRSGGMRSELKAGAEGGVQLSFDIPAQLAPLFLAFELQIGGRAELSRSGQRFAVPVGMSAGKITRMGEHRIPSHPMPQPGLSHELLRCPPYAG